MKENIFENKDFCFPYLIGIKGAGMVGLATLLKSVICNLKSEIHVKGSDISERFFSDEILENLGIFAEPFDAILPENCDVVIYSAAYDESHPQRVQAKERNIPQYSYFEFLGMYAETKDTISVIGTHGKTTTTALLGYLLGQLQVSPTVLVGSKIKQFHNQTVSIGDSRLFVVEACEYKNHFFHISPEYILCTNVDYDHVDFFPTKELYRESFLKYVDRGSDDNLVSHVSCKFAKGFTYGEKGSGADVEFEYTGRDGKFQKFQIEAQNMALKKYFPNPVDFKMQLVGKHNISNFTGAWLMSWLLVQTKVDREIFVKATQKASEEFQGIGRRLESYGEYEGALLFDDYGHHPVEVKTTLAGLREAFPEREIWLAFQSHTYSRTRELENEFAESFQLADRVFLAPIYSSAREEKGEYTDEKFAATVQGKNPNFFYGSFEEIALEVKKQLEDMKEKSEGLNQVQDDHKLQTTDHRPLVISMGAGDVWKVVHELSLKNKGV